jgi:hypothetical protein
MGAGDLAGDGAQRAIPFAIHLEAIIQDLDLVGPAVPLADQMGSGLGEKIDERLSVDLLLQMIFDRPSKRL